MDDSQAIVTHAQYQQWQSEAKETKARIDRDQRQLNDLQRKITAVEVLLGIAPIVLSPEEVDASTPAPTSLDAITMMFSSQPSARLTPAEIRKQLPEFGFKAQMSTNYIYTAIARLKDKGVIKRNQDGTYSAANAVEQEGGQNDLLGGAK